MRTERLYFDDAYQVDFEARIVERKMVEGKPGLIVDRTCFYPESGGQPSDKGTISGVKVEDVIEEGERIVHIMEREVGGDKVKGHVDWEIRFDHMQQHTGQHILSQSFFRLFSAKTLSFHLGEQISTIEIDMRAISDEEIQKVEEEANTAVFEDIKVKTYFVPQEKISEVPLRKPPVKKGRIRVVEVSGYDYSACGGTHCRRSGEVGLIKIIKQERIRGNIRFSFVCGRRALRDYALKNRVVASLSKKFTVGENDVISSIESLEEALRTQKKKLKQMQKKILENEAREIVRSAEGKIISGIFDDREPDEARSLALNIIRMGEFVVLYGMEREKRAHLVFASSESLKLDMRELLTLAMPHIEGRGGGSSSLVEAAGEKKEGLKKALEHAAEYVKKKIKE